MRIKFIHPADPGVCSLGFGRGFGGGGPSGPPLPPMPFARMGVLVSGQSLSIGAHGIPLLSTIPKGNLQLHDSSGTYSDPTSGTWSMIPLIAPIRAEKYQDSQANTSPYPDNVNGETVDVALANALSRKMSGTVVTSNAGQGSASSLVIQKGGTGNAYASLINEANAAKRVDAGYGVGFGVLVHGESDFNTLYYDRFLTAYQSQMETDVKAVTGQSGNIPLIYSQQTSYPGAGTNQHESILACSKALRMGKHILRTGTTSGFDTGGITTAAIPVGGGWVEWTIISTNGTYQVGIKHAWQDATNLFLDFSLQLGTIATIWKTFVLQNLDPAPSPVVGDVYRITVDVDGFVYMSRNGVQFYSSVGTSGPTTVTLPVQLQVCLRDPYTCVGNITFSNGADPAPWLHLAGQAIPGDSSRLFCSGPDYAFDYYTDRVHMLNTGYRQKGEMIARCAAVVLSGGVWKNFLGTASRVGNDVTITFGVQVEPLVWDTVHTPPHQSGALAAWALGNGFEARTGGSTGTIIAINSVTIIAPNQVVVSCASQPDYVAYGLTADLTNPSTLQGGYPDGRCGLLMDSDSSIGPVTGQVQPNRCMVQEWSGL